MAFLLCGFRQTWIRLQSHRIDRWDQYLGLSFPIGPGHVGHLPGIFAFKDKQKKLAMDKEHVGRAEGFTVNAPVLMGFSANAA